MRSIGAKLNLFAVEHDTADSDDRIVTVHGYSSNVSADRFFTDVSKILAFDDCTNDDVTEIYWHGERVWYFGWEPGMHFRFGDICKNVVWEGWFPEFDH